MMLMAANQSSRAFHELAKQSGNRLGWLLGPSGWKRPRTHLPYALDNDAFTCWRDGKPFDVEAWRKMLLKVPTDLRPLWVLVPDVVANKSATLDSWEQYSPEAAELNVPLAFAVQDGMQPEDVPSSASVIFVGGTYEWKWRTAKLWCESFPRVHIGRTNGIERLWIAQRLGAESCDGTGYFRGTINGLEGRKLQAWLHHVTDPQHEFPNLGLDPSPQKHIIAA